jgi:tetratricopeptide (TPR) repeat protein
MKRNTGELVHRVLFAAVAVFVIVSVSACTGYLKDYRRAQDQFNAAADADNKARLDYDLKQDEQQGSSAALSGARANYALAYKEISKLVDDNADDLKKDQLYGSALSMKALCEWRLGRFTQAVATADAAVGQLEPKASGSRDLAVMTALPGMIRIEEGYRQALQPGGDYDHIKGLFTAGLKKISEARNTVDAKHPVQLYLMSAQLAGYRNWQVAIEKMNPSTAATDRGDIRSDAGTVLGEFKKRAKEINPDESASEYWRMLLGL